MSKFQNFLEDNDMHIGLMSKEEVASERASFDSSFKANKKKPVAHKDAGMKLVDLKIKIERLIKNAEYGIKKNGGNSELVEFVEKAKAALEVRTKKSDFLDLITMNSDANRKMNNSLKGA